MALRIRIEHGQDAGTTYRLPSAGLYRVGRSPHGSFQVLDMKVSKEHFEVLHDGRASAIRDLGSSHGTLLNGQRVDGTRPLLAGDEIRVGLTVLRALSDGPGDKDARPVSPLPDDVTSTSMASTASGGEGRAAGGAPAATGAAPRAPGAGGGAGGGNGGAGGGNGGAGGGNGGARAASVKAPDPLVGTTLGGYRLLERVGAGGMGSVYRAEQLSLHREVALKLLAEKLVSDSAFVDQFVNEARAAGQLNHPNVVQVYDVGQVDGRHYFSMEFIHGGSLEDALRAKGKATSGEALPWFLDAANALIFAEKKGILHRDIKPDNFMLGQDGSVKLCDLGLAKKSESADLLAQGIIGTPHFIAPEAVRRRTDVDARADLYSLGCTFFRLLTGKNPYPAGSVKEILLAHLNQPVPRVAAGAPDTPKELDEIVFRLMQKDPAARFQSAQELWEALDKVRLQLGLEAHGLHPGRAKKLAVVGGVVAVAALGVAAYFVTRPPKEKTTIIDGGTKIVEVGESPEKVRAQQAMLAFQEIENRALRDLQPHDQGENWRKPGWADIVKQLKDLSEQFQDTEAATKAVAYAQAIETHLAARQRASAAFQEALAAAAAALKKAADDGLAAAATAEDALLAEAALDRAAAEVTKVGASVYQGDPLVTADDVAAQGARLDAQRGVLAARVTADATAAVQAARQAAEGGGASAASLSAAIATLDRWLEAHPSTTRTGPVAKAWSLGRAEVTTARGALDAQRRRALRADLLADRASYHAYLVKEAYAPPTEDGSGGGALRRFQFAEAAERATARAAAARSPAYRDAFLARAAEATLMSRLPGVLSTGFAAKGFKDRLTGRGWAGLVRSFTPEGVQVADRVRTFAEEGLGWFLDLFFEKGEDRYELTADDLEALGYVAEVAALYEEADARFELAGRLLGRAAELDPARSARLARRRAHVDAERQVAALLVESDHLLDEVTKRMAEFGDLAPKPGDLAASQRIRKEFLLAEGDLRARLTAAAGKLAEAEDLHPTTVARAWLSPASPPAGAAYADEALPTDTAPPAPPPDAPAMGEGEAAMAPTSPPAPPPAEAPRAPE